jgi:hypothetical protein
MAEQDHGRWDQAAIAKRTVLVTDARTAARLGPFRIQAAIPGPRASDISEPRFASLHVLGRGRRPPESRCRWDRCQRNAQTPVSQRCQPYVLEPL